MAYNDRTRGPENTLKIPVISLNEDFRKRQKKDQGTCVRKRNAFSLLHHSPFTVKPGQAFPSLTN